MAIAAFIFGISIGLVIYYWQKSQLEQQLKQMLASLSDKNDLATAFSATSLVRREIAFLQQHSQELERTLHSQKELLDKAPIGYLQVDADNQLLWCNQQARTLLKIDRWQPGQIRLLLELVRSYELDQLIEETRRTQTPKVKQWNYYPANYIPLNRPELEPEPSQQLYQKSIALKGYSYPFDQEKIGVFIENQQPLVELSQSRERAFSDLTHELRTPLTSISLVAETLQKRLQNPERRWVEQMLKETHRLIQLVQDWLEISQLQTDPNQSLQYQTLELKTLILSAWQSIMPLATQKDITLDYCGPPQLSLSADQSRLTQVFLNLLDNGIKYSPPQQTIRLQVEEIANQVHISVIDNGPGFTEVDLPYVFERLYRGDFSRTKPLSTSQTLYHSSGLGLSIAQQIIQAHGGSIQAQNHPQTGGAWIQFTLPLKRG